MGMYINAISQSANNENVRELLCKVTDKTFTKVAPIVCANLTLLWLTVEDSGYSEITNIKRGPRK